MQQSWIIQKHCIYLGWYTFHIFVPCIAPDTVLQDRPTQLLDLTPPEQELLSRERRLVELRERYCNFERAIRALQMTEKAVMQRAEDISAETEALMNAMLVYRDSHRSMFNNMLQSLHEIPSILQNLSGLTGVTNAAKAILSILDAALSIPELRERCSEGERLRNLLLSISSAH